MGARLGVLAVDRRTHLVEHGQRGVGFEPDPVDEQRVHVARQQTEVLQQVAELRWMERRRRDGGWRGDDETVDGEETRRR